MPKKILLFCILLICLVLPGGVHASAQAEGYGQCVPADDDISFAGEVLSGAYDSELAGMADVFIDVSWTPGNLYTVYREENAGSAEKHSGLLARLSEVSDEELSRSLLEYVRSFSVPGSIDSSAEPAGVAKECDAIPDAEEASPDMSAVDPPYFVPYEGPGSAERLDMLADCALSRLRTSCGPYLSSAEFVCVCASDAGFTRTLEYPATCVPDELFSFLSGHTGSELYYLKPLLGHCDGECAPGGFTGCPVFFEDGCDRELLEWMPGCAGSLYAQCGLITGAGPGYVSYVTTDSDGIPEERFLDFSCCPDSAVVLHRICPPVSEIIIDCLRRCLGYNDAVIAGIAANICMESGFNACALGDGGTSFGLCQWHGERLSNLAAFCTDTDSDITDYRVQIAFLCAELPDRCPGLNSFLLSLGCSAEDARRSAAEFCLVYERPDNVYAKAAVRSELAAERFFPALCASG